MRDRAKRLLQQPVRCLIPQCFLLRQKLHVLRPTGPDRALPIAGHETQTVGRRTRDVDTLKCGSVSAHSIEKHYHSGRSRGQGDGTFTGGDRAGITFHGELRPRLNRFCPCADKPCNKNASPALPAARKAGPPTSAQDTRIRLAADNPARKVRRVVIPITIR